MGKRRVGNVFWGCLGVALVIGSAGCSDSESGQAEAVPRVKVFEVGVEATGQSRTISGQVKAAERSSLAFGVAGRVLEVLPSTGEAVVEGQLLARLDDEPFTLRVEEARAAVNAARARLVEARSVFERQRDLFAQRATAEKEVDTARTNFENAESELDRARQQLRQAELDLGKTRLTAPLTGRVVEMPIDTFQEVGANDEAAIIQSAGIRKVDVLVPETLIRNLDYGQSVRVRFPTLDGVVATGRVTSIGAETGVGNAFEVTVLLDDPEVELLAGMTATVTFNFADYLDGQTAYLVPISAIALGVTEGNPDSKDTAAPGRTGKHAPVYLLDPDRKRVEVRWVRVGDLRGNDVEVFGGLERGDLVVSAGVAFLRDGMAAEAWTPRAGDIPGRLPGAGG
ncbi:MAG: efflux RND transporter periplasmic adaptor subunit [Planctomycetota bacterium]